ncbi:Nitrite extrusion protein [Bacillus thuringiensis serovar israelensis ATCC 35646]|nr:Nitrite extrusion protein [Bacillus thuringiensis serovar israelensis ATCC 35646]
MKGPNFQLSLQTSNLVIGFMVWVILSSLMPYIKADIPLTRGTNFYGNSSTGYFRLLFFSIPIG